MQLLASLEVQFFLEVGEITLKWVFFNVFFFFNLNEMVVLNENSNEMVVLLTVAAGKSST